MQDQSTFDILSQERAESPLVGPVSTEVDDRARLSQELWIKYRGYSQNWRDQLIEDWDFFLGAQISQNQNETNKRRSVKSYTVDVIFQAVEQAVALLTSNRPRFSCTGTEDSDTRIAQVYSMIMQYLWHTNSGTAKLKHIIKDYYVGSVGWMH